MIDTEIKDNYKEVMLRLSSGVITSSCVYKHHTYTPYELCIDMMNKVNLNNKDILVISNFEFVLEMDLSKIKSITYITTCDIKEKIAKSFFSKYNIRSEVIKINDVKDLGNVKVKFDVVMMNPPYNKNVHLKFLEAAYKLCKEFVICVHPSAWLTAQKPGNLTQSRDELLQVVGNHIVGFDVIDGNKIFNIGLGSSCVITKIDKKKTTSCVIVDNIDLNTKHTYSGADKVNRFYIDELFFDSIKTKIWDYCLKDNIHNHIKIKIDNFFITIPSISGNPKDLYQFIYKADRKITNTPLSSKNDNEKQWLSFKDNKEAENCLDYLVSSRIAKYCLMIVKNGNHIDTGELKYVPYFDFSEKWDDDKIAKKLGLTQEEIDFIMEVTK